MLKGLDYPGISVVTMCHDGSGKYLLEQRSDKCRDEHFTWSPVGSGGLENGETLQDAVVREVYEECGASVTNIELLGFREVFRELNGQKTHWISFDFKAKVEDSSLITIKEPEMRLQLEWFTLDKIPNPLHSQFPIILEKYKHLL